ncbi:MAG: TetR/AcrR family transcriptional regulator [Candidatus Ozemobacteraceae bacterium]
MTTPKQKERSDRMFHAALEEFSRQGFHQASVDAIAAKAGVSKATLYSHFVTKEALFIGVFERVLQDFFIAPKYDPKSMTLDEGAREAIRDLFVKIAGTPESLFFFHCMNSDSDVLHEELRNKLLGCFVRLLHGEMGKLREAQQDGFVYAHLDLEILQHVHIGMLLQVLRFWWGQKKRIPIERLASQFTDVLLYGISVSPPSQKTPARPNTGSKGNRKSRTTPKRSTPTASKKADK